ncbi:hypothetical protein HDE_04793 [Halotydeus destructor]|nr:hypothetical protein HDE_04793 [Halotydeus destructor]
MGHQPEKYFIGKSFNDDWYEKEFILVLSIISDATLIRRWVLVIVSLYTVALISWSKAHSEAISIGTAIKVLSPELCESLIKMKKQLNVLKSEFNDCFAIFPLLILSGLFLESSGLIQSINVDGVSLTNLARLVMYTANMLLTVFLVILAIKVQRAELQGNQLLIADMRSRLAPVVDAEVKAEFKRAFKEYQPLDAILFDLDRSLFLGFAGSLVSFTVMVLQFKSI